MQYHDFNASQNHQIIKNIFKNISEDEIQYLLNHSCIKKYQKNHRTPTRNSSRTCINKY